jgi:hypothetical protein
MEEVNMSTSAAVPTHPAQRLSVVTVGSAMSLFLVISFLFCLALGLISTRAELHNAWFTLLPGVTWLSWRSVVLGVAETLAYGWYVALVFVPLYNWAAGRQSPGA